MLVNISFTYNKNINGPSIDPWGTPHVRFPGFEFLFSTLTTNVRFSRYDLYHAMADLLKPKHDILLKKISWLIVSNAFCKSISIIPVSIPFSIPLKILLFNKDRQESVECFVRKPD